MHDDIRRCASRKYTYTHALCGCHAIHPHTCACTYTYINMSMHTCTTCICAWSSTFVSCRQQLDAFFRRCSTRAPGCVGACSVHQVLCVRVILLSTVSTSGCPSTVTRGRDARFFCLERGCIVYRYQQTPNRRTPRQSFFAQNSHLYTYSGYF